MEETKIINIQWEKHEFTIDAVAKLNQKQHFGLYQIYADHPVYGRDRLVYIGKANYQNFAARLGEPQEFYQFVESILYPTNIRIGMILDCADATYDEWSNIIDEVEKILIISHLPAFNARDLKMLLPKETKNLTIFNWGDRGDLLPEISSLRVSYKYWECEKVLEEKNMST